MKKSGGVLAVIGIIFLVLIISAVGAAFYFYNYYVFKTIRVCVGEGVDSGVLCNSTLVCSDLVNEIGSGLGLESMPDFISKNFQNLLDEVIYCNSTCFVKRVRGIDYEAVELEMLDECEENENEFVIEIRGKEGLEILEYLNKRK